jgi:hypothetical protein
VKAKKPSSWKKPKASMVRWPLASMMSPRAPSMSKLKSVPGPVAIVSSVLPAL